MLDSRVRPRDVPAVQVGRSPLSDGAMRFRVTPEVRKVEAGYPEVSPGDAMLDLSRERSHHR